MKFDKRIYRWQFLSTLSLRRATQFTGPQSGQDLISIHALLAESDLGATWAGHINTGFLSTLSLRRATRRHGGLLCGLLISIHALLAESDVGSYGKAHCNGISIHALLAESDSARLILTSALWNFYPRSPCGERLPQIGKKTVSAIFLSTLSLRRATSFNAAQPAAQRNFYPRSPCGERHLVAGDVLCGQQISIHALLAESDVFGGNGKAAASRFLSTLSLRRATAEN